GSKNVVIEGDLKDRLQDAVSRLVNRQSANGAFGAWSSGSDDDNLWLSSFVTDFLLRAREKGFAVPEDSLVNAIDYLKNTVGNAPDIESGKGEDTAYALYVLARAGKAPAGDLKYLADTKINDFGSPMARAQIAAALAILGDRLRADQAFSSALTALDDAEANPDHSYRYDYGSVLRDASGILALASDTKAGAPVVKAATGSPIAAEPAASNGLTISRTYYTPAGDEVDPSTVKQNSRLVVVLSVAQAGTGEQNGTFLLVDPLPAGFEIENPALVSSG